MGNNYPRVLAAAAVDVAIIVALKIGPVCLKITHSGVGVFRGAFPGTGTTRMCSPDRDLQNVPRNLGLKPPTRQESKRDVGFLRKNLLLP